jgi:hypothetical protein
LLADDLEDERPEGIERWKVVHPGPRVEVRSRVDELREDRIGLPQDCSRLGIGNGHRRAGHQGWTWEP